MTSPRFARLAAQALARAHARDGGPEAPNAAARANAIATLEHALVARKRRSAQRRAVFGGVGALAVAAAVGLALFVSRRGPSSGGGSQSEAPTAHAATRHLDRALAARNDDDGATARVEVVATDTVGGTTLVGGSARGGGLGGTQLPAGSRIVTPASGSARLALSTGTHLTVGPRSELSVVSDGTVEVFRLDRGTVRAEVAKLHAGERFIVDTSDVEVEVRGTVFEVRAGDPSEACGGARTRVVVSEGVVTVRQGAEVTRVAAGEHWPHGCAPMHAAPRGAAETENAGGAHAVAPGQESGSASRDVAGEPESEAAAGATAIPASAGPTLAETTTPASSRLTAMNDAYAHAVALRRNGDATRAIAAFARFTDDYADGPLAESARVEHLRLLVRVDHARATAAAAGYLRDFPDGFAREEATRVLE